MRVARAITQNRIAGYFRNFALLIGKELIHLIMLIPVSLAPDEIVTKTFGTINYSVCGISRGVLRGRTQHFIGLLTSVQNSVRYRGLAPML